MMRTRAAGGGSHCSSSDELVGRGIRIADGGQSIVEANAHTAHPDGRAGSRESPSGACGAWASAHAFLDLWQLGTALASTTAELARDGAGFSSEPPSTICPRWCPGTTAPNHTTWNASRKIRSHRLRMREASIAAGPRPLKNVGTWPPLDSQRGPPSRWRFHESRSAMREFTGLVPYGLRVTFDA